MSRKLISQEEVQKWLEQFQAGKKIKEIALTSNFSESAVRTRIIKNIGLLRDRAPYKTRILFFDKAISLLDKGLSLKEIGAELGLSWNCVNWMLKSELKNRRTKC